jgi:hypothetical protein
MKNDHSFKLLAAVIIAGVILAFASAGATDAQARPARSAHVPASATADTPSE